MDTNSLAAAVLIAVATNYVDRIPDTTRPDFKERQTVVTHHFIKDGKTNAVCTTNKVLLRLEWIEVKPERVYPTNMNTKPK